MAGDLMLTFTYQKTFRQTCVLPVTQEKTFVRSKITQKNIDTSLSDID